MSLCATLAGRREKQAMIAKFQLHDSKRDPISRERVIANQAFARAAGAPFVDANRIQALLLRKDN